MTGVTVIDIHVPESVAFADLSLARDESGVVCLSWGVMTVVCQASGVDVRVVRDGPPVLAVMIVKGWFEMVMEVGSERIEFASEINEMIEDWLSCAADETVDGLRSGGAEVIEPFVISVSLMSAADAAGTPVLH